MNDTAVMLGFAFGFAVGLSFGVFMVLRDREPIINFEVTPEVVRNLDEKIVMAWLDARGLVWQPRGIDFKVPHK